MLRAAPSAGRLLGAALLLAGAAGCGSGNGTHDPSGAGELVGRPGEPRDVLLITVDTLRHDAVGFASAGRVETPAADRLAAGGRVFSFAHAHAVVTLPSHASILTGRYPYEHGIRDNGGYVLDAELPTLATLLRERDYRTAAFVSAYPLDRRFGLTGGFQVYDDEYDGYQRPGFSPSERPGHDTVSRALAWWREHAGETRFLWVHVFTPHFPYDAPEPHASRHPDAPYWADAEYADAQLAPLIDAALENGRGAIVVYTSDHGESLGEHGELTHSLFAYEATLRVPLVVQADGLVRPGVTDAHARHVDILPTVLHLLGAEIPAGLPGRALFAPAPATHDAGSYFEALSAHLNRGWAPLYGRLEGRIKSIDLPIPELYRLDDDPAEERNLAAREAERLRGMLERIPEAARSVQERALLDAEEMARLRALGYAAGRAPVAPTVFDESTDPKNLVRFDRLLDAALTAYHAGDPAEAIRLLRDLIEDQPSLALAYSHLAFVYTDLGRLDEAIAALRLAVERGVSNESIHRKLALALMRAGNAEAAAEVLLPHEGSAEPETQSALGRIAATRGQLEQARRRFERALEIDPTFPTALMDLGILNMMAGRFDDGRPLLERALEQDPFLAEAWTALGAVRSRAGDRAGAIEAWRRAVEVDPRATDALWNLAGALRAAGDRAGAAVVLERYAALVDGAERTRALALLRELRGPAGAGG